MVKLIYLQIFTALLICANYVYGSASCNCSNPIYLDKPQHIDQCATDTGFLSQISLNYKNAIALLKGITSNECNFAKYIELVKGMEAKAVAIAKAFFLCTVDDCESDVTAAYNDYKNYYTKVFDPFIYAFFTKYPSVCVRAILESAVIVYTGPQNIMTTIVTCAKLRLKSPGIPPLQLSPAQLNLKALVPQTSECNCVQLKPLPFPSSRQECFTKKYISKLRDFIESNYKKILTVYAEKQNSECGSYAQLEKSIGELKNLAKTVVATFLEKSNASSSDLSTYQHRFYGLLETYSPLAREYIENNTKQCYLRVRKLRDYPIGISINTIGIVRKCIQNKDWTS